MTVVSVYVQFQDYPRREVEPDTVWYDTFAEATRAIEQGITLGADVTVALEHPDHFDNEEDPDLDDWPAPRHLRVNP